MRLALKLVESLQRKRCDEERKPEGEQTDAAHGSIERVGNEANESEQEENEVKSIHVDPSFS